MRVWKSLSAQIDEEGQRTARPPVAALWRKNFAMPFEKSQRWMRGIGGGLAVLSLVFLTVSILTYASTHRFVDSAVRAPGKVVKLVEHRESGSNSTYCPVFVFRDESQREHKVCSSVGTSSPSYEVGDDVTVLYRVGEPEKASLGGFLDLWLSPLVWGFIGAVQMAIAVIFWVVAGKMGPLRQPAATTG
jgi:hypothetical protein